MNWGKGTKKAELTTQQIVTLIILIISFVVILFLLFRLDLGKETSAQLCRNSVLQRGGASLAKDAIPLQCEREYVCITSDGTCEQMVKPEKVRVKTKEELFGVLADKMARCWWMFGEGKVDYVGKTFVRKNFCSICSQIAFDDSVKETLGISEVNKDELYEYLREKNYSESESYLEYLFGTNDLEALKSRIINSNSSLEGTPSFGTFSLDKQVFVVMGIVSEPHEVWKWGAAGAGAAVGLKGIFVALASVGVIGSNPIGWVAGAVLVGVSSAGGVVAQSINPEILAITVQGKGVKNQFMAPTIVEVDSEKFAALNCEDILTLT